MKKQSVESIVGKRTSATTFTLGPGLTLKRVWFVRATEQTEKELERHRPPRDWQQVETFCSWNDNDNGLTLWIDGKGRIFLTGGEPYTQRLTYPEAMSFLGDMFHESEEGGDKEGMPAFYKAIASALRKAGAQ